MNRYQKNRKWINRFGLAALCLIAVLFAIPTLGASILFPAALALAPKFTLGAVALSHKVICLGAMKAALLGLTSPVAQAKKKIKDSGEALPEDEFQKTVLDELDRQAGEIEEAKKSGAEIILADASRWPKELKTAFEELTKSKESINGLDSGFKDFTRKLKEIETLLRSEVRSSFGSPIQRISNSEEMRTRFNCAIRLAVDSQGDMRNLLKAQMKAIGEDTSPGSTMINTQLFREIYTTLAQYGAWNTLGVRRMGTKLTRLPVKTVRPVAQWILTEGGTIADDTNKAGTESTLQVEVLAVLLNISLQLLQDSEFDVTADVMDDFAEAFAYQLDFTAFQGNGTADGNNGGYTGLLGFGTAAVAITTHTSVAKLTLDDFVATRNAVDVGVLNRPNKWWMHPYILGKMCLIKDANGRPIFQTALEAPTTTLGSILGAPIVTVAAMPSTDTISSKVAVYGDPNGYVVGIREDFSFEASDHFRWNALQRSFRGYGRAGCMGRKAGAFGVLVNAAS